MTALLALDGLSKRFGSPPGLGQRLLARGRPMPGRIVHAVADVTLALEKGEVVGIVGESGCGKSTLGRMAAGIMPPTEGTVRYAGTPLGELRGRPARDAKLRVQMIFQDPYASLNPRRRVTDIIGEAPRFHGLVGRRELDDYVAEQMRRAGLDPSYRDRLPHQFSGGQRQRIGIARALAVQPEILVCDEAVAALDVSIQAQILNLFMDLRERLNLSYLFISHDLGVIQHLCDRVAVMYLGRVVEEAPTDEIFARPAHPYTQALLAEVPRIDTGKRRYKPMEGELPSPLNPPSGCHFHPRCPHVMPRCRVEAPALTSIAAGHRAACHLHTTGEEKT